MRNEENLLYLVLGCWGRNDGGFITCSSASNPILRVHEGIEDYKYLIKYFENLNLFNRKVIDYNAVRSVIFRTQQEFPQGVKDLWDKRTFRLIENFTIVHKSCGIYLSLEFLKPDQIPKPSGDREVIINPTIAQNQQ